MSIVIVGVGSSDFSEMVRLDGDEYRIKQGCRDIVQFVKFNDIKAFSSQPEEFK